MVIGQIKSIFIKSIWFKGFDGGKNICHGHCDFRLTFGLRFVLPLSYELQLFMCLNTNINFIFFPSILGNPTTLSFPCAVDTAYSWGRITINCVITFARSMAHPNIESLMFPASLLKMMNQVCIVLIEIVVMKRKDKFVSDFIGYFQNLI